MSTPIEGLENINRPIIYLEFLYSELENIVIREDTLKYIDFVNHMIAYTDRYFSYLQSNKDLDVLPKHLMEYMYFKSLFVINLDNIIDDNIDKEMHFKYIEYIFFEIEGKELLKYLEAVFLKRSGNLIIINEEHK